MSIRANFKKFVDAATTCEKHEALREMESEVKRKFEKEVKGVKSVISKIRENGIHIDISFGKQEEPKKAEEKKNKKK